MSDGIVEREGDRIDKRIVRLNFNRRAAEYDRHAGLQRQMADRLLALVRDARLRADSPSAVRGTTWALDIGCGTGYVTARLAEERPEGAAADMRVVAVDIAERMLEEARRRLAAQAASERVDFRTGDAEKPESVLQEGESFDLIVSNAAFQWFDRPLDALAAYVRRLAPGGFLALSTFGPETFRELHESFRTAETELGLPARRRGPSFPRRDEWAACALSCGAEIVFLEEERRVLTYASVRDFLAEVRGMGASYSPARWDASGAVRELFRVMERHYVRRFGIGDAGGARAAEVPATYHVYYIGVRRGDEG